MELYVARHGETEWNAVERLCGRTDLPLNSRGREQANALAEELLRKNIAVDRIIASPMIRAQQTAEIVAARLGTRVETEARLIEQNYGLYEGGDARNPDFLSNKKQFAFRYPEGESMMQVAGRVYPFLDELKRRGDLHTVLLISHGGTCRVLNTYFEDVTNEAFAKWRMGNAECLHYRLL